jgi:hypothetical protein
MQSFGSLGERRSSWFGVDAPTVSSKLKKFVASCAWERCEELLFS